jgi:hypothetical protein
VKEFMEGKDTRGYFRSADIEVKDKDEESETDAINDI